MKKTILLISILLFACESSSSNSDSYRPSESQFNYPEVASSENSDDLTQYISTDELSRSLHLHYFNQLADDKQYENTSEFVSINLQYNQQFSDSIVAIAFENAKLAELNLEEKTGHSFGKSFGGLQIQRSYSWSMMGLDPITKLPYNREFPDALKAGETPTYTAEVKNKSITKSLVSLPTRKIQVTSPRAGEKVSLANELTINFSSILKRGTVIGIVARIQTDDFILIDIPAELRKYMVLEIELPTSTNSLTIPQSIVTKLNQIRYFLYQKNIDMDIEIFVKGFAELHDSIDLQLEGENKPLNVFISESMIHQIKTN